MDAEARVVILVARPVDVPRLVGRDLGVCDVVADGPPCAAEDLKVAADGEAAGDGDGAVNEEAGERVAETGYGSGGDVPIAYVRLSVAAALGGRVEPSTGPAARQIHRRVDPGRRVV